MIQITFLDGYTINPGDLSWRPLEALGRLTVYDRTSPEDIVKRSLDADVIIVNKTRLTADDFKALPRLKLVCVAATGYDRIDIAAARRYGVTVTNCAGYSSRAVAQMVVSLILEVADGVGGYTDMNADGEWARREDFCYTVRPRLELVDKQMAIVGFGNIGQAVYEVMRTLGVKIYAVTSKTADALPSDVQKITMEEAFAKMDIISLNCPLTTKNAGFVNADLLAKANPDLILVNTARGGLIVERDVAKALEDGRLRAYCTDVLTQEPPLPTCPILGAPRAYVTPHIAWNTPESRRRILAILVDNIKAFLAGSPISVVN